MLLDSFVIPFLLLFCQFAVLFLYLFISRHFLSCGGYNCGSGIDIFFCLPTLGFCYCLGTLAFGLRLTNSEVHLFVVVL